ncbi:hypothetical protein ACN47E_008700 [Coniothyrium glycines]
MWEVYFVHMMLWHVDPRDEFLPEPPVPDVDPPLAPSWSWAKIRGAWCYRRPPLTTNVLATLTKAELHLAVPNKFGALEKGIVTLQGYLVSAVIQYKSLPEGLSYRERFNRQEVRLVKDNTEARVWQDFVLDTVADPILLGDLVHCFSTQMDRVDRRVVVRGVVLKSVGMKTSCSHQ